MKLNRPELKMLIKECLIEILADGLSHSSTQINESRSQEQSNKHSLVQATSNQSYPRGEHPTDKISFLPKKMSAANDDDKIQKNNLANAAKSIASNPMIAEMLADTAMRSSRDSLRESSSAIPSHEQMIMGSGDNIAKKMFMSDPTDIFSESSSKWAALAFAEKKVGV